MPKCSVINCDRPIHGRGLCDMHWKRQRKHGDVHHERHGIYFRHGLADYKTPEYCAWRSMRNRCLNPRHELYPRYGGRGITICKAWDNFAVFLRDMGPRISAEHSLDRINNDGNYEPGNCRWATDYEQQQNTSNNTIIEFKGEKLRVRQWEIRLGLSQGALWHRIKNGWPLDRALTTSSRSARA